MKSEAAEDVSAGLASQEAPSDALSEVATKETPEEAEEDVAGGSDSSERAPLGCVPLPVAACCVCLDLERVSNCIRSEKICILPILACLLSLALCTAGLKWVFVDKIFEYEPPTHLDLKRIGQDPIINSDFTQNSASVSPSTVTPTTPSVPGQPKIFVEGDSTAKTFEVHSSKVPVFTPTAAVTVHTNSNGTTNQYPSQTLESNDIVPKTSKTSSHVTRCSESERNYCVNGGKCFTLEVTPGNIRRLCRCPNEFTGDRCQNYVMASFYSTSISSSCLCLDWSMLSQGFLLLLCFCALDGREVRSDSGPVILGILFMFSITSLCMFSVY
uniref:Pro-neuregulin-1, membrane-bound isoform-like n=1 Tax=Sinocyclocheilus rhinocerous TaxID=307959 RepID=A0A673IBD9_9TELE